MGCNCNHEKRMRCKVTMPAAFPGYEECDKLDPKWVDAYVEIKLDPENPTGIILDSSWGEIKLDLLSIVKAGETVTHLELAPDDNPTVIRYTNEHGEYECISGDELSRIISMHLLKDVDQTQEVGDGDVYMYNSQTNLFEPFDLKSAVGDINIALGRINTQLIQLSNRISDIEKLIYNYPADKTTKIPRGDINLYSDYTNTNSKAHGFFTHDPATDVANDEYFSQKGENMKKEKISIGKKIKSLFKKGNK